METNIRITATCECESGTIRFDGNFPKVRKMLGTLTWSALMDGIWHEEESQARALVPTAHHLAITQEVFNMGRNPRILRFREASAVRHPSIGCFSLATIPKVLSQPDIRFDLESPSIATCEKEHWQMNTLINVLYDQTYKQSGDQKQKPTLFGKFLKTVRKTFQALINERFEAIAQREDKHLTGADIDILLELLSTIAYRYPLMQFVHRRFCTQKLLVLLIKKVGNNLQDQLAILRAVMIHPELKMLLAYRICADQRSFSTPIYTAVRILAARGGDAALAYALEILRTGNNYALIGLSYSPNVYAHQSGITSSQKPDFKKADTLKRYSALSQVINVLNEDQKNVLFQEIFSAVREGCNDRNKALGLIAFLYNLSETQPEVEDRGRFTGIFVNRYQIYKRTLLATLFNAVDRTEIESFAIAWFSLHAIGIMQGFFCGKGEFLLNLPKNNQEFAVSIFEEKLKELPPASRIAMRDRMCNAIQNMKRYYSEENQKNLIDDLVSTVAAMFNRTEHEWTWRAMWTRVCQTLGKFVVDNPELVLKTGVVVIEVGSLIFAPKIEPVFRAISWASEATLNYARSSSSENPAENEAEHPNTTREAIAAKLSTAGSQLTNAASEPMRQAAIEGVRTIGHNLSDDHSDNRPGLTVNRLKSEFVLAAESKQATLPQHPIVSTNPLTRKNHLNAVNLLHPLNS